MGPLVGAVLERKWGGLCIVRCGVLCMILVLELALEFEIGGETYRTWGEKEGVGGRKVGRYVY